AHEEVGVVDLAPLDRMAQGADDRLLADHVVEAAGAVAAVERGARGHGLASLVPGAARLRRATPGAAAPPRRRVPCPRDAIATRGEAAAELAEGARLVRRNRGRPVADHRPRLRQ